MDVYQFALPLRAEYVDRYPFGRKLGHPQLLAHLAPQSFIHRLAVIDMAAHGRIPASGLNVFPLRPLLQVKLAAGIEQMQVHHRMQQHRPAVAFAARSRSHDNAGGIYHRKKFRTVIASHGGDIYVYKSRRSANRAGRIPCPREPYNDTPARGQSAGRRSRRPAHCPD